jgi:hypothetical protein
MVNVSQGLTVFGISRFTKLALKSKLFYDFVKNYRHFQNFQQYKVFLKSKQTFHVFFSMLWQIKLRGLTSVEQ